MVEYHSLQAQAETEGRQCVVGALILDEAGRVFVQRRGPDRRLFPGCWDIVGGHVRPGEGILEGLRREVAEETGWRVVGTPHLAHVADWETVEDDRPAQRREFDFLVEVEGDRDRPRLEFPKQVECRWVGSDDLDLLADNRGLDDDAVRRLVELALRSSRPAELTYPHTTAFLNASAAARVDVLRAAWDPAMAHQIAAHVTVTYPAEIDSVDLLLDRLQGAADRIAPFRLRLGRIAHFGRPDAGIFIEVDDVDEGWSRVRESILGSGAHRLDIEPHVTIVHPRTTNRGPAAWEQLAGKRVDVEMNVEEISMTAFDGRYWPAVATLALEG
jgi:8-oxo-dGTP diphosphatase